MPRFSTLIVLLFIAVVVAPVSLVFFDYVSDMYDFPRLWGRFALALIYFGLVDMVLHLDKVIRNNQVLVAVLAEED